ncbi:mechanosensitive ion channel [Salinicola endophyticus]|uniref:Mechanosensitive ion channel n=1 Tax=Salinicola endophyticus TaxID=1949083 RepID=A0ABY8FJD1_9GAMM|nr:mechanosensitive ion channel domain-containing protein [Salinicola endophyticus]WFF42160.1 mechanosensitive ion channel [Salinicola endophyticus]
MKTLDDATQTLSTQTLAHLQQRLGDWLGLPGWILLPAAIVILAAVIDLVLYFVLGRLEQRLVRSPRRWDDPFLHALRLPLRWWIWISALMISAGVIGSHLGVTELTGFLFKSGALITLLLLAWSGIRLIRRLEQRLVFPPVNCRARPVDQTSASALTKIVGAVLIVTLILIGLQILGVSMSSILAMGGFGGLVIGFAARDVMANFFGGMVVHLDKPFVVGDWIRSPDREIEGMVEDIGWRLTTIRTFAGPPLYVPNAWFSQISVETPTRMVNRRLWETVGLRYQDAGAIEAITGDIRQLLKNHEEIDQNELITVNFTTFGQYALELMIYAFTRETDWQRFHEIKQEILLRVRDIIEARGAELALPASRLYLPEGVGVRRDGDADVSSTTEQEHESDRQPESERGQTDDARHGERASSGTTRGRATGKETRSDETPGKEAQDHDKRRDTTAKGARARPGPSDDDTGSGDADA